MRTLLHSTTLFALLLATAPCVAGHPFFSKLTQQATGPYTPRMDRYIVVDPAAPSGPGPHGAHPQGSAAANSPLWTRHDVAEPVYPYGWFGARSATRNWSHVRYYGDYADRTYLMGK